MVQQNNNKKASRQSGGLREFMEAIVTDQKKISIALAALQIDIDSIKNW
ncbi:hypothetical protein [Snodgrassella sp. CFCC 13594]|nr:hypothetical protein [Snodgrassella sp. CFCC 13594]